MASKKPILSVRDLVIKFSLRGQTLTAIRGASLELLEGETLAIVGESGSGKSVFTKSFLGMLDQNGWVDSGSVLFEDIDISGYKTQDEWRRIRGKKISMVFQDPMTALNPLRTIGKQIEEVLELHQGIKGRQATLAAIEILGKVGIPDPGQRHKQYPHEFSGGMRQRVVIAIAMACKPRILICDEPTTALDVTIQAQILALLKELQQKHKMALILITHDLGVVSQTCNQVAVMYGGTLVEKAPTRTLFANPRHPYSFGLIKSIQSLTWPQGNRLYTIPGQVPGLGQFGSGCVFVGRCDRAQERCKTQVPPMTQTAPEREVACFYPLGGQT